MARYEGMRGKWTRRQTWAVCLPSRLLQIPESDENHRAAAAVTPREARRRVRAPGKMLSLVPARHELIRRFKWTAQAFDLQSPSRLAGGMGWMAAKAQTSEPNFEVVVNAPSGETTIECVRRLRARMGGARPQPEFEADEDLHVQVRWRLQVLIARVGGWVRP